MDPELRKQTYRATINLPFGPGSSKTITTSRQFRDALKQVVRKHGHPGESLGGFVLRHMRPHMSVNEYGFITQRTIQADARARGFTGEQHWMEDLLVQQYPELEPYLWKHIDAEIRARREQSKRERLEREREMRRRLRAETGHTTIVYDYPPPTRRCVRPAMSAEECEKLLRVLAKARTQHKWIESVCLSIETELDKIPGYYSGGGADQANGQAAGQSDACEGGEDAVH